MIVASRNFNNRTPLMQNNNQNKTSFKGNWLKKGENKVALGITAAIIIPLGYYTKPIFVDIPKYLYKTDQISRLDSANAKKHYYRSGLAPRDNPTHLCSIQYLDQVIDSLKGGKSTPNKTFKMDSLTLADSIRLEGSADSLLRASKEEAAKAAQAIMDNAQKQADSLRAFAKTVRG